ncbi:MAG: aminopeptidase N [Chromatiaceae bacterium]|nr:aminopeptidase N [Candidatus Thioaporhodococcus sediminis]
MSLNAPAVTRLSDYRPPPFLIPEVALRFDLGAADTWVEATLEMQRNPMAWPGAGGPAAMGTATHPGRLRLDGEELELEWLRLDGRPLGPHEYEVDGGGLTLFQVPDRFRLETRVRIHPERNTHLEGLYLSKGMLCTQCEAEGFRRITYFLDRPDVMSRYTVTLEAEKDLYPVLLANGNPAGAEDLPDGRQRTRWIDPYPKPCYLFALVAGDLSRVRDRFRTLSGREVALNIWVEPENLGKCGHAMTALKNAMGWDEDRYGREYDLEVYNIVAVSHFNMGAMENKGLNIFNAKAVLASPATATDLDFQWVEGVIAHEYFHNWSGNRVTCRDWFQLSLKEGFTVFRDQEFSADRGSRGVKRIADVRMLRARQFPEDAGPLAHPVRPDAYIEINNFYTATVYEKGAELVRMLATLLGPELFRRATDLYFTRHDGEAVTTDDFLACMEAASGRDLGQFRRWYTQAGTPELAITGRYDAEGQTYELRVRQHTPPTPGQPHKEPLHLPLALGLLDPQGRDLPLRLAGEPQPVRAGTRVLELHEAEQVFRFVDLPAAPLPSLLRGFSAPVKVHFDYRDEELMFLMAHDSDGFNRWEAAQTLAQRLLLAAVAGEADGGDSGEGGSGGPSLGKGGATGNALPRKGENPGRSQVDGSRPGMVGQHGVAGFIAAFHRALTDRRAEPALLAEILTLPSETYLADQMAIVDVDGIHRAREGLIADIAATLRGELLATYERLRDPGPYQPTPTAIGRRGCKNLCLAYLAAAGDAEVLALCQAQFAAGHNLTDQLAALRLLVDAGGAAGEAALAAFHDRWARDELVLDKWFALQAGAKAPETLARVRALLDHPAYDLTNPNRVRSLVMSFTQNQVRFHAADGAGYVFLGEQVRVIDPLNPHLAARLLQALVRWRRYNAGRQALMRAELERVLALPGLSKDSFEVAAKALA